MKVVVGAVAIDTNPPRWIVYPCKHAFAQFAQFCSEPRIHLWFPGDGVDGRVQTEAKVLVWFANSNGGGLIERIDLEARTVIDSTHS